VAKVALNVSKEEFVLNFIKKNKMELFTRAYIVAQFCHKDHRRKDGTPYIGHPNEVCYNLILQGVTDEILLSIAICHDVPEELLANEGVTLKKETLATWLNNSQIAEGVFTLSRFTKDNPGKYFAGIEKDVGLILVKTTDRFVNMRRSFYVFNKEAMGRYIFEVDNWVLPMSERIINSGKYPQYENALRSLRTSIKAIMEIAKIYIENCV
jgi:(p)ppGpp synthase/HD superfamily hydrolase